MKMVSAAKLKGDENRLAAATPFNSWAAGLSSEPMEVEGATFEDLPDKILVVPFSSEKGLCGGVNSFITRSTKAIVKAQVDAGKSADIVVIGDKEVAEKTVTLESRDSGDSTVLSLTDLQVKLADESNV